MQKTQALADAGVLPDALAERVASMLPGTREALQRGQDGVSAAVCQEWSYDDAVQSGWRCEAQWLDSCGLVTEYSVTLSESGADAAAALDAYRSYLCTAVCRRAILRSVPSVSHRIRCTVPEAGNVSEIAVR